MPESLRMLAEETALDRHRASFAVQRNWLARELWLIRRAFASAYEDNCFGIAKGAAYSLLLCLFPILTTLTALLLRLQARAVVHLLARFVQQVMPPGTEDLVVSRLQESGGRPLTLTVFSILLCLWAGSGAMISLMEGFEAAYRIPSSRHFLKQRAMAMFLVLIVAFPAVAASGLVLFGNRMEFLLARSVGISEISAPLDWIWRIGRHIVAFGTVIFVTGLLYYFGTNHRPEPRTFNNKRARFLRVWPGALLATFLWLLTTVAFAWYVAHVANYNAFYGGLVAVIILVIWLYLNACISLIGCEYNAESERADSLSAIL